MKNNNKWITEGFDSFRQGSFGNGGQNLYVSKAGVLQRIYQYDLTHNGYMDLVFANCQNHNEAAPAYVYSLDGKLNSVLPAQGAVSGIVADLSGNGLYNDVVICGWYDAAQPFASADIYFGSEEPYSEKYHFRLPAPWASSVACGRFNGGKPALAFAQPYYNQIRLFEQLDNGFEWDYYVDLPIKAYLVTSGDLDGDGYDDLIVRGEDNTETRIYWGGADGIDVNRFSILPELPDSEKLDKEASSKLTSDMERPVEAPRQLQFIQIKDKRYFTLSSGKDIRFYEADAERNLKLAFSLPATLAVSAAAADLLNDGNIELVVGTFTRSTENTSRQESYIFWPDAEGKYNFENRTTILTDRVNDLCILPDGRICFAQGGTDRSYTSDSQICKVNADRTVTLDRLLTGDEVRKCFVTYNKGREPEILFINHHSRSSVGFDKAYIYTGDKDGYSADRRIEVPAWCAVDSIYADLDDDGWGELVVCNNSENSMHLDPGHHIHHFGPDGFEPEKTYTIEVNKGWAGAVGDFDHDGRLELFTVSNMYHDLRMFKVGDDGHLHFDYDIELRGNADLRASSDEDKEKAMGSPRWPITADLNGNGYLDLIVPLMPSDGSSTAHKILPGTLILWGGPDGKYSLERSSRLAVHFGLTARVADLNKNGYPDLVIGSHTTTPRMGEMPLHAPHESYLHIYWGGPDGYSDFRKTILRADAGDSIAIADFNNDGYLDIFVGNYHGGKDRDINSTIYWNREGHFSEQDKQVLFTHSASGCIAADFNNDGYIDLAVANHKVWGDHQGYSEVWWNGPNGFNPERTTKLPTAGPHGMTAIEPANIMDRGPEEFYYSAPYTADFPGSVKNFNIIGEVPENCWVKLMLRKADNISELDSKEWQEPEKISFLAGEVLQYKLVLGAKNCLRSPRITKVEIEFI